MTERQRKQSTLMAAALIGALLLIALPGQSWATIACTADTDNDGLCDAQESAGITLINTATGTTRTIPPCAAGTTGTARLSCVDPNTKDIFIAIVPVSSGSLLPTPIPQTVFDPFSGFSSLGITAHPISPNEMLADRTLNFTGNLGMKAVRVAESLDTNGTVLGFCNQGTPLGLDGCVVYTQRIINFINTNCTGNTTTQKQDFFNRYTVHTIMHEAGHSLGGLTSTYNSSYGGYHYKTGAGYVMDQTVSYTVKSGACTFNISNTWNTTLDPPTVLLNQ
jgi:hypothetical protein